MTVTGQSVALSPYWFKVQPGNLALVRQPDLGRRGLMRVVITPMFCT
jgi:hypothetical protein